MAGMITTSVTRSVATVAPRPALVIISIRPEHPFDLPPGPAIGDNLSRSLRLFRSTSSFVSRPKSAATRLRAAKQVITAVAWLNASFSDPASSPANRGPKLVMTGPEPLQNETAAARTWVGNNSGRYTAWREKTPTQNPGPATVPGVL
jgi:hypothetical protein